MTDQHESRFLDDPEFQSLLVGCLESLQRGETIDRDALARDFPRFADEIGQFLNDRQLLEQVASDFGDVPPSHVAISAYEKTLAARSAKDEFSAGGKVRYIGEYEILEEIARGGMGVVFKARQQKLQRTVALKMILAGRLADTSDIERFQREARAAGRLRHPAIVPVHEIGEHDGRHYFTMDYVDGRSLAEIIREETLAPKAAAQLLRTTAEAVHYAHEQGTVHRDLKPANILLESSGQPQVTDFGLAKMLESVDEESRAELTASGQILGTPSYMSPEQASGKQELVGPASDIYSLGAILYACLTGRAPFVADSPVDTLMQVMNKEPVSPRDLNPSVPKDLETICLKCLTKEPHKRYGTAQELADDLGRFLEDRPVVARPVSRFSKTLRWCRRNPAVASLLILVLVSMATGTIVSAYYAAESERRANLALAEKQNAEYARDSERKMRKYAESMTEFAMAQQSQAQQARRIAEQHGDELRRQLYIAQMPRALEEWQNGNTARVQRILEQHVPEDSEEDLRGFEWHYLKGLTESSRLIIGTGRQISGANISPDGQLVASAGRRNVLVHSLEDGSQKAEFPSPGNGGIAGVAFDSTSQELCVDSGRIRLWNLAEDRLAWEQDSTDGCKWCAFTPDDSRIVSVSNNWGPLTGQVQVRAADSGELLLEIPTPMLLWSAVIDPSGHSVYVACHDHMLRQWDLQTGGLMREWACQSAAMAMTGDIAGRLLLLGNTDGRLERHDTISGKRIDQWGRHATSFRALAVDETGSRFAGVGRSQQVHIFDATSGEPVSELRGHADEIIDVNYRVGFHEVVTTDASGTIRVWDSSREQGVLDVDCANLEIAAADFSPEGRWLAYCHGIPWDRDRKGTVRLLDVQNMTPGPVLDGHEKGVFGVAITERTIYSAGEDGKLIAWDATSFERLWTRSFAKPLSSLAATADGKVMVVGDQGGDFMVLADPQAEPIATFSVPGTHSQFQSLALAPDGHHFAAASQHQVRVFDWQAGTTVLDQKHARIRAVAFDPTGRWLAVTNDGDVVIYETSTWQRRHEIKADSQPVAGIAFHPTFPQFATRSIGGSLKLWETNSWQNVLTLPLPEGSQHDHQNPVFSPDGRLLIANRHSTKLRLLCTGNASSRPQPLDAEALSQRARQFVGVQKWPEAYDSFDRACATGSDPWNHVHAAESAAILGQNDRTRQRLRDSVKLAESMADEDVAVAAALIQAAQLIPDADPLPDVSLAIARRAWEEEPKRASYALPFTLFRQQRDAELVEFMDFNRGHLKPTVTFPLLHCAALYRLGRVEEANAIFDRAADGYAGWMPPSGRGKLLPLKSFSGFIWDQLLYREVSDIAKTALDSAIADRPDDAALLAARGLLHLRWHRWPAAFADLKKATVLEPDNDEYLDAAASVALLADEPAESDRLISALVAKLSGPEALNSIWEYARIATRIPEPSCIDESFLELVQASAAARPRNSWRHVALVGTLHRLGRLEEALAEQDRIRQTFAEFDEPGQTATLFRRGLILFELGKRAEARNALRQGEAILRTWMPPPRIYPKSGRDTFMDSVALHRELKTLIEGRATEPANADAGPSDSADNDQKKAGQ